MKRLTAILAICTFLATGCATDVVTGKKIIDPNIVATVKADSQLLLAAVNFIAPTAAAIIGVVGNPQEKAAMSMASASLGTLNAVVANAQGTGNLAQSEAAFSALLTAWNGLDSAYKNQPEAAKNLAAIPIAVDTAKLAAIPTPPVPTPAPAVAGALN